MAESVLDELPPPQRLALAYAPRAARDPTLALLALDARLGAVLRRRGEPVLSQMRLAWWRDMLGRKPDDWPRGDPVLALLREWREPAALVALVDGWEGLLGEALDPALVEAFAQGRREAFGQLAREIGQDQKPAETCAGWWALADLAANMTDPAERAAVIEHARSLARCPTLSRALRPLAVLSGLARRSLARGGTPLLDGPASAMLAMRLGILGR